MFCPVQLYEPSDLLEFERTPFDMSETEHKPPSVSAPITEQPDSEKYQWEKKTPIEASTDAKELDIGRVEVAVLLYVYKSHYLFRADIRKL